MIDRNAAVAVTTIEAQRIITLDPSCPEATMVAVEDGKVLHVGSVDEVTELLDGRQVETAHRFPSSVVTPGFVEAHGHLLADGSLSRLTWLGFDDRPLPDGSVAPGCRSVADVLARLRGRLEVDQDRSLPLVGWGYDPVFHDLAPLDRHQLDQVSDVQPIVVMNASLHILYANSSMLRRQGIDRRRIEPGVIVDGDGEPTGEFHETAMALVDPQRRLFGSAIPEALGVGATLAQRAGCTTVSELALPFFPPLIDLYGSVVEDPTFPVRVVYSPLIEAAPEGGATEGLLAELDRRRAASSDRFSLGPLKWIADGSIQGFTAKLGWPGYCGGTDHGTLLLDADQLYAGIEPFHRAGYQAAIHTNGELATSAALDALEHLLAESPRLDHRHRLEHCQMASVAQWRRMAALGVGANLFANHLFYWGDVHRSLTMGPDKARRLDAAKTALDAGVSISIHSDHPVTPLAPLFTMWCAVNRVTRSGHVLGPHDRLSALEALDAVTLGAAWLMRRDHLIGSIEVGKLADLTVLSLDPLHVDPGSLRSIEVEATFLGGALTRA